MDLGGRIPCIVDSGPCDVGVESTVIDLAHDPPLVLRPGGVILASTNCTALCDPHRFRSVLTEGAGQRTVCWLDLPPMSEDFAGETGRFVASAFSIAR